MGLGELGSRTGKNLWSSHSARAGRASSEGDLVLLEFWIWGVNVARNWVDNGSCGARVGRDPSVPLLTCLSSLSTFSTGSGAQAALGAAAMRVVPAREPRKGAGERQEGGMGMEEDTADGNQEQRSDNEIPDLSPSKKWLPLLKVSSAVVCDQHFE